MFNTPPKKIINDLCLETLLEWLVGMKIFREEVFGGVIFDTENLRYELTSHKKVENVGKFLPFNSYPPRSDILSSPIRVYFELTRKCNLHCKHCFSSSSNSEDDMLSKNFIFKMLEEMQEFRILDIRFTGGEPTCRDDWFDILKYSKDLGFAVSINTNGVYKNQNEILKKYILLDLNQITISIDGLERNHDFIRGKNSFKSAINTLIAFYNAGLPLRVNTVISKRNYHEIPLLLDLVAPYIKEINFFYMRPIGRALNLMNSSLSFDEHLDSAQKTLSLKDKYKDLRIMHFEESFRERSITVELAKSFELQPSFPYGGSTLAISFDGKVWPHGYSPYQSAAFEIGDLKILSLSKIWYESVQLEKIRLWMSKLQKICKYCFYYLENKCAGINFEMEIARQNGDINHNPFCKANVIFPRF